MRAQPVVDFGADICASLENAGKREWLLTNGLGGYASGTISGVLTRRYHGLLVAALQPPGGRTVLVAKFDETLAYDGRKYELGANRWSDGSVSPNGFRLLERFRLEGTTPVWTFACADALLEKRVWMQDGANTTFVRYEIVRAMAGTADVEIKALVNYRGFHCTTVGSWQMQVTPVELGLRVYPGLSQPPKEESGGAGGETPFYLLSDSAQAVPQAEWYRNFELAEERSRGLDSRDDHFLAGIFRGHLALGQSLTLALSTDSQAISGAGAGPGRANGEQSNAHISSNARAVSAARAAVPERASLQARAAQEDRLLEYWVAAMPQASLDAPPWIRQLVLAAAQFSVRNTLHDEGTPGEHHLDANGAYALVAGYPWFGEWSRDTMIALPGLTLDTGRSDVARSILRSAASFLDQGMLPNVFPETRPEAGGVTAYNTADATLWYFEALRQYYAATGDKALIEELYGKLVEVIDWHERGTRFKIHVDSADGLLHAGQPGVQLTWMDATVDGQVVTPRIGKPVEINALWYNALRTMARFTFELNKPTGDYVRRAELVQASFERFWNAEAGYCYDVVDSETPDSPGGNDASLRPNQILAVSLPESPLNENQRRAVVNICTRRLITPYGLRTLDPSDSRYRGAYSGTPAERDAAYHQGTAWAWLLGPFVLAHLRVYRDPALALSFLEPIARNLLAYGVGTVGEIFEGDAPFRPCGAIAQAWSVGEVLRAWHACHEAGLPATKTAAAK